MSTLEDFATAQQIVYLEAVKKHGGINPAARALGKNPSTVSRSISTLRAKAANKGFVPEQGLTNEYPDGFNLGKVTVHRDATGAIRNTWERMCADKDKIQEMLTGFAEGLANSIKPAKRKPQNRKKYNDTLMPMIQIGDAHIGMRAFSKETRGRDFDTDIATSELREAFNYLVGKMEPAKNGIMYNAGDFVHANTQHGQTYSGTPLDVDTRHYRVMKAAAEVMIYGIDKMLDKCKTVTVVCARGNHDTDAAGAIQLMLEFYYSKEPRVNVLSSDGFFHYVEFGKNLFGFHHGDKQKPETLVTSMARDMAAAWGRAVYRQWFVGHFHKEKTVTLPGCRVKVCGALPPPDSWHAASGYSGDGTMELMTFRESGGVHSSHEYTIFQNVADLDAKI